MAENSVITLPALIEIDLVFFLLLSSSSHSPVECESQTDTLVSSHNKLQFVTGKKRLHRVRSDLENARSSSRMIGEAQVATLSRIRPQQIARHQMRPHSVLFHL